MRTPEARKLVGKVVAWDEVSSRYAFTRTGTLDRVAGRNVCISGNWLWMTDLRNFREASEDDIANARG